MKPVEVAIRIYERKKKYFNNLEAYLDVIKEKTLEILPDAKIYLFGSVVERKIHPFSDIDIAIVSDRIPESADERAGVKIKILEGFDIFTPFEFHLLTRREWDEWYSRFVKDYIRIE